MRGSNTIILNQGTMLQAMQLWLKDQFKDPPEAVAITTADTGSGTFKLTVNEQPEAPRENRP